MHPLQQAAPAVLADVLRAAPLSAGKVAFAWRAAAGPAVERAAEVRLESGVLIVEPSSVQWGRELTRSKDVLLARMQRLLGADAVNSLVVRAHA
jgi:predicted nucleic acid-binding Zn ribbon protein